MAVRIGDIYGTVTLRTKDLEKSVKKAQRELRKIGQGTKEIGQAITTRVGLPLAGMGALAVKSFADFQKGALEVQTLLPDMDTGVFNELIDQTQDLAVEMGMNLNDATKALYQTISAGVDPNNALAFLETSSKAAIAGVTDTETAVDGLSSVINAYGMQAFETERVSDKMFTAVRLGKTTFDEIARSVSKVAPLASSVGVSFDEVMSSLVTLTKQGVPTETAFTQMRAAMSNIIKPTKDMQKAIKNLGFATGEDLLGAKGFLGAINAIKNSAGLTADEVVKAFGSVEGLSAVFALTGQNFGATQVVMNEMINSAGATQQAFEVMSDSASFKFQQLRAAIQNLAVEIGERLAPFVTDLVDRFRNFITENEGVLAGIGELATHFGIASTIVGVLLIAVAPLITHFLVLAPLIGLAVVAFQQYRQENESIIDTFKRLGGDLENMVKSFSDYVGQFDSFEDLIADVTGKIELHVENMVAFAVRKFNQFKRENESLISALNYTIRLINKIGNFVTMNQPANPYAHLGVDTISGAFAGGGRAMAGQTYLVGEKGPELFTPNVSGYVTPNDAMGGNITMNFAPGTDMSTVAALKNMKRQIADIAINAVTEHNLRTA